MFTHPPRICTTWELFMGMQRDELKVVTISTLINSFKSQNKVRRSCASQKFSFCSVWYSNDVATVELN